MDWQSLTNFFDSSFFVALTTILAALGAYAVYITQKRDHKRDAANIILIEIQNAERLLNEAQEKLRDSKLLNKHLLPIDSWNKSKYLFVRNFDRDEWDRIGDFYNRCKLYDEAVSYNKSFFQKNEEQIRVNMLRAPSQYIDEYLSSSVRSPDQETAAIAKASEFQALYLGKAAALLQYEPMKPINDARSSLEGMDFHISQSTIGSKLKKLAGIS